MKKTLTALGMVLLVMASYVVGRRQSARDARESTNAQRVLYWVDPMHPDYKSDHPGVAPDCGMQLEPVYAEPISASGSSATPIAPGLVGIDTERQQLYGIRVSPVERSSGAQNVRVLGRV